MKNLFSVHRVVAATAMAFLLVANGPVRAATVTWTNSAGGGWNTAANWNPNTVPGPSDTAIITTAGVTVSLNSDTTVGAIFLGTNGTGTVTLTWSGGVLAGTMTVATNSVLNIEFGGVLAEFNGFVLTNYGTVNWTNTPIHGVNGNNQRIYNYGLWNEQSDDYFAGAYNNGSALFDNFGTFRKSGTSGLTLLDAGVEFNNFGIVQVQSGTLDITGGTSSGSTFATTGGGMIDFYGCLFTNTTTFTGAGNFLTGDATFGGTIVGTLNWVGNNVHLAGTITVASNSVLNIVYGGGLAMFRGCVLTNCGTVNWTNTDIHGVDGYNEQIYNYGLWNAQSDNAFLGTYNGGSALFDNFGTFRKSGNSGVTTLDAGVEFNNTGLVQVENGTLAISGATSSGGDFAAAGGGIIDFSGCLFTNTTTFTGPGSFLTGDTTFGGTIVGTLNWSGGVLYGNLTVPSNSALNIGFGGGLAEFNGFVLTNYGTVNWTNTTIHGVNGNNQQIYNYGLWNEQSDDYFAGAFNSGTALFDNFGTFRKSGNSGVTTLDAGVEFNNIGLVQVESGTLAISGATSSGGYFAAAGGGIINFSGCLFTNTTTFTGPGSFLTGDTTFGGTLAGTLNWEGNNGHLIGNLTVASNSVLNIVFGGGLAMFRGCVLTNYGTVNWADTDIHGVDGYNEQIYNYGLWNAQSDNTFAAAYNGGSALFDNFGTFRKSGNTGVTALNGGTFNNTGILDAQSGNIALQGAYTLANGTKMSFGLGSPAGNGSISLSGAASFAGSLSVNLNNFFWPVVGNSFNLLNYTSESGLLFTNTTLPAFITWQTNYNPSVFTLAVVARQTNTAPANLTMTTLNNTNLSLQWPGDHTGWRIQAQTNPVTVGLSKNWATLAGSSLTNQFIMPIGKTNGAVFFRMIYP